MKKTFFNMDQESTRELLAKAIEIADEDNRNNGLYLQAGTYSARDILNIELTSCPTYLEDNMPKTCEHVLLPTNAGFYISIPRANIFWFITQLEDALNLCEEKRHAWIVKGAGKCIQTFKMSFPDKETMKDLGEMLDNNPDKQRFLAIGIGDGTLHYYDEKGVMQSVACQDYTPSKSVVDLYFGFHHWNAKNLWGECTFKLYQYRQANDDKDHPTGMRILITNPDGWQTGTDIQVPAHVIERIKATTSNVTSNQA